MVVHGTPSHPSPSRSSPSHPSLSPLCLHQRRVAVKTSIAVTLPSSCPSPSHCAVHCRAIQSQVVHCCCRQAVHCRRIALLPSRCRQAAHCFTITVKPTIAKPLRHPSLSRPSPSHSSSLPLPSRFHQCPITVTMSIAAALP
jgi:hypothetical protein